MRILITGSQGYIAKAIYNRFYNKYDLVPICRKNFDLCDQEATTKFFKEQGFFDVILHLAIKGGRRLIKDDQNVFDDNIKMYNNLLINSKFYNKFISFGSGAELYNVNSYYGSSKKIIRNSILNQKNFYNIRIFGVFDENEEDQRFIKSNIKRYIAKNDLIINQDRKMDFFYMQDLLKIIEFYIDNEQPPKEIDCCYEEKMSLSSIANIINNLSSYKSNIIIEKQGQNQNYIGEFVKTIDLDGLTKGIYNTYVKLQNHENGLFNILKQ